MNSQLIYRLQQQNLQQKHKIHQLNKFIHILQEAHHNDDDQSIRMLNKADIKRLMDKQNSNMFKKKQQAYKKQIQLLQDSLKEADYSYQMVTLKFEQQRELIKQLSVQNENLKEQIQKINQQKKATKQKSQKNLAQIQQKYCKKIKIITDESAQKITILNNQIKQLEKKIQLKQSTLEKVELQSKKMKELLYVQTIKRKQKQKQHTQTNEQLQVSIKKLKTNEIKLKKQIHEKMAIIIEKDGIIKQMQKAMREMNMRINSIEKQANKKILKQKINAKNAKDGLQMIRKYSDMELTKSKKRQKMFMMSQKHLLSRIKETSNNQDLQKSLLTIKSSQKDSLPIEGSKNKLNLSHFQRKPNEKLKLFKENQRYSIAKQNNRNNQKSCLNLSDISTKGKTRQTQKNAHETDKSNHENQKQSPSISNFVLDDISEIIINQHQNFVSTQTTSKNTLNLLESKSTPKLELTWNTLNDNKQINMNYKVSTVQTPCFQSHKNQGFNFKIKQ